MKYIKQYEKKLVIPELKKYIIWDDSSSIKKFDKVDILQNTGEIEKFQNDTIIKTNHLFKFFVDDNKLVKVNSKANLFALSTGLIIEDFEECKWRILYQTNNLKDCLAQLDVIVSAKKYNL